MLTCPKCGIAVEEDVTYCPECGESLKSEAQAEPVARPATEEPAAAQEPVKVLGGSIEKNTFFGLVWIGFCIPCVALFAWVLNLVVLISEKDKLTVEEKRCHGSMFAIMALNFVFIMLNTITVIPYIGWVLGLVIWPVLVVWSVACMVFAIITAIKAFQGGTFKIPLAYQLASMFVK